MSTNDSSAQTPSWLQAKPAAAPARWQPVEPSEAKPYRFAPIAALPAAQVFSAPEPVAPEPRSLQEPSFAEPDPVELAYARGMQDAQREAQRAQAQAVAAERARWEDLWQQWAEQTATWRLELESIASEVALDLAGEMAIALLEDALLGQDAERIWRASIQSAITKLTGSSLVLEVPSGVAALIEPSLGAIRASSSSRPELSLHEDPSLAPTAFRVHVEGGVLEADPQRRIARLKAALRSINVMELAEKTPAPISPAAQSVASPELNPADEPPVGSLDEPTDPLAGD